jgi:hypothetical protein
MCALYITLYKTISEYMFKTGDFFLSLKIHILVKRIHIVTLLLSLAEGIKFRLVAELSGSKQ